jgi:multidrug efflux pump subunit AcrA (membrane-fusion protein)
VEVTIPNPKGRLVSGMVATLNLGQAKPGSSVLVLPLSAIVASGEHAQSFSVFPVTRDGDREVAKQRPVKPGSAYGDQVEIVTGVSLGDRAITSGATLVKDGQVVRVIP